MANPQRGEVSLVINGERHILRLTLGALAALEARLKTTSLIELAERFESGQVSARELLALLAAGLAGAGSSIDEAALSGSEIEGGAVAAVQAGMEMLARAFAPLSET